MHGICSRLAFAAAPEEILVDAMKISGTAPIGRGQVLQLWLKHQDHQVSPHNVITLCTKQVCIFICHLVSVLATPHVILLMQLHVKHP